ncbi:MAG: oligosaccharide flippase family protein [Methylomicrobium sp.]
MNPIRQLISQTAIYGLSSIIGRFLNYLLVPLYTYTFNAGEYGVVSEFYAYAGFFAVLLICGLETGYFRFRQKETFSDAEVYAGAQTFLILVNLAFLGIILLGQKPLADRLHYHEHPEYIVWFTSILVLDAVTALPFAKLRAENRAWRFAGIKLAEIFLTIGLNLFFLVACPKLIAISPNSLITSFYDPALGVGYIFLANLLASGCKFLLLIPEMRGVNFYWQPALLKPILAYSLPMVIIGFAGMVNEMLDRALLKYLLPYDIDTNLRLLGIYGACYKLSILMTLFVQAFRYAGEPFFFGIAGRDDAQKSYALVMHYFVIFGIFIFLFVTLFINVFQYFIGTEFREGLDIVPVLLLANLLLGIYVNLSIWYKLTDRTALGAWVSLAGAALTASLNVWWIPIWGYQGSAWATLICYAFMVILSWLLGRHYYPVPYRLGKIGGYFLLGLSLYSAHRFAVEFKHIDPWFSAPLNLAVYLAIAGWFDIRPLLTKKRR